NYNKSAADLWGKKPDEGNNKWDGSHKIYTSSGILIKKEDSPMAMAIRDNKEIHAEEIISECENLSRTNLIAFATPYKNSKGDLEGALNVLVDITERKQLEEKLTGLSLVARKTSNAVIISDAQARITWVNQSFIKMSGYTLAEVLGKRASDFLNFEETNLRTVDDAYKAFDKVQPARFEILNKGKHGNKYWLDVDIQPFRDAEGNLSGFISVETDITELKYIHEELKKSENKLRAILDSTSDDNILVDPDYRIISINKVATEHLKLAYGTEPLVGQLIWDYVKDDMRTEFEQTFHQAIAGFMSKKERELAIRGEVKMWFEFCFYPVYANDGTIIGVAINSKNIHAKKTAELKVQHQNKKLKEIAFTQSHTLRRPVANIMGLWNLINYDHKICSENVELFELMQYLGRSVTEMDEVIREITSSTRNIEV
ncbi:MAG: PAS domain-containing protein, partial [Bacteroidota bacterium]